MIHYRRLILAVSLLLVSVPLHAQIAIHDDRVFPESITSTPEGVIFIGSESKGEVLRAEKDSDAAEVWIKPGTAGLQRVLGVLADTASQTLWVCSSRSADSAEPTALKAFDLISGTPKASYAFPGGAGLCNDIAVSGDGTTYVSDTTSSRVLRLRKGGNALDVWASGQHLEGIDGIAIGANGAVYVNTISTGKILRIPLAKNGAAASFEEMKLSQPLQGPDGMRSLGPNMFVVAEGRANRLAIITIQKDEAKVEVVKEGLLGITAVTRVGNVLWVNDAKFRMMRDAGQDPGAFTLQSVPLPQAANASERH